ncbi:MAG: hypothetical protein K0R18_535 [Bacillales bacterium]|jgi:hypothetical protein|nr:hypothetical protein [Bacillales bacterium]
MINIQDLLIRKHCPICENELMDLKSYSFIEKVWGCKNKCYVATMSYFGLSEYIVTLFDHEIKLSVSSGSGYPNYQQMYEIESHIEYWRNNQMYLTKIMGVN